MPKRIILVRHGQTDFNLSRVMQGHTDTFLNKTGLTQAINTSKIIKKIPIDIIYASDLKRAWQTAFIIAQEKKLKVIKEPLLRERNFGDIEGRTSFEAKKLHSNFSWDRGFVDWGSELLGIESNIKIKKRINKLLEKLEQKHKNQTVLLVTHGGFIWNFVEYFNMTDKITDFEKFFANAGISIFVKIKQGYNLET